MADVTTMRLTGGCACGRVRFAVDDAPTVVELCHCSMCRRAVGNIHMAAVTVPKVAVTWTGERRLHASSPIAKRSFCPECGTPLTFAYDDSARLDLMAGAIDQLDQLRPAYHFGVESRLDAFRDLTGLPEHRTEDSPEIASRWQAARGA